MVCTVLVGLQWGDEGKGKVIDLLARQASCVVRSQGGNNAGHTLMVGEQEFRLHLVPSGILYPHTRCYIGAGTVIDPEVLLQEIVELEKGGIEVRSRLRISPRAHLIFPFHKWIDEFREGESDKKSIGTTKRGIGPCYADRVHRIGLPVGLLSSPEIFLDRLTLRMASLQREMAGLKLSETLQSMAERYLVYGKEIVPLLGPVEHELHISHHQGDAILLEGAQGSCLDLTYGTYPYVTSSSTLAAGVCAGAGIGPTRVSRVFGVAKVYATRVGHGPFPTECESDEFGVTPEQAREIGTTTGRVRRMGWLDAVLLREAIQLNGVTHLALTKLDVLDKLPVIKICTGYRMAGVDVETALGIPLDLGQVEPIYEEWEGWQVPTGGCRHWEELPEQAQGYLQRIEEIAGAPIALVSVGPERESTLLSRWGSASFVEGS